MKKLLSTFSLLMALALVLTACGPTAAPGASGKPGEDSKMPKEILVGVLGAQTGTSSSLGKAQQQGIDLAFKEINAAGGINGVPVRAIYRDDEADPTKSKTAAEELVDKEKVSIVIGPTNSTPGAAVIPYLMESKIPTFIVTATGTTLINENTPYAFRILPTNKLQAAGLVKNAKDAGYERVVLLADTSALGIDGMNNLKAYCEEYGIKPVAEITYKSDDADMTPVAQQIKDANADCGLFWTLGADGAKIVRALERVGHINEMRILGYTGMYMSNFKDLAGDGASQCSVVAIKSWAIPKGQTQLPDKQWGLYKKLEEAYGVYGPGGRDTNPSTAGSAYDVAYLVKWAIEKAGSMDPDAIKDALENHGSEYESYYASKFVFAPGQHEGFNVDDICMVSSTDAQNDLYYQS